MPATVDIDPHRHTQTDDTREPILGQFADIVSHYACLRSNVVSRIKKQRPYLLSSATVLVSIILDRGQSCRQNLQSDISTVGTLDNDVCPELTSSPS